MVGLYQLFILAVVSSVVSAEEVTTTKYSQPFPLDMPVSQTCKEKGQAKCKDTCGWAECVAIDPPILIDFAYAGRKESLPDFVAQENRALSAECCPAGHEFRCCEMPENRKYTWVKKNANEMISALDEKPECKPTEPKLTDPSGPLLTFPPFEKYYCACEFSSYHRMMDGMCCSKDDKCSCCWTDPIISKLPRLLYAPKKFGEEEGKECGGTTKTCKRKEGWPVSSCCGAGYHLVEGDERFVSIRKAGLRITGLPTLEMVLLAPRPVAYAYQHIPRYAWRTSKPHTMHIAGFSADRYMGNPIIWKPATITYTIPAVNEELLDSYWVPRVVPPGTGDLADMVGALDKDHKCKDKPVYCACDPLHFDRIMKGMCCDKSTRCECCQTDPTLSKMKKVMAQDPKTSSSCKDQIKANFGEKPTFCQWTEGWKQSAECCDEDYKLVIKDDRYYQQKIMEKTNLTPRYAIIEGADRHYPLCRNRLPWIYTEICAYEWYWVPQKIGRS